MDTISIVVPVYNASAYIEKTIDMVLQQTYSEWELLLIEDCSTDRTEEVLKQYLEMHPDDRIHVMKNETNAGAAQSRNKGIMAATGSFLAFLDADDVWKENKLALELAFMKEKQAAFVFSSYEFGDENAKGTGRIVHAPEMLTYKQALSRTVIFTSTVLLNLKVLSKEQVLMPEVASEDSATWWKILRAGFNAYGLDEVLAVYRRPADSLSSNKIKAVKRIWNLYRNVEKLSVPKSMICFFSWAVRATLRRI